jgi:PAS domain S-box-containing protein
MVCGRLAAKARCDQPGGLSQKGEEPRLSRIAPHWSLAHCDRRNRTQRGRGGIAGPRSQDPATGRLQHHRYFFSGLEGRILEANDAFLHLVGHDRDDLVSGRMRWTDLTPPEWRERDRPALADQSSPPIARPYEKEFFRKDGSRVPVLDWRRACSKRAATRASRSCSI